MAEGPYFPLKPQLATKNGECSGDLFGRSEGYAKTKDRSKKSVPLSKPATSSSDTVSSDSEDSDSPGGGGEPVAWTSKPSLQELRQLPVTNWYLLGLQLKVRQQDLERIQLKYGRDLKLCRTKMFGVWRREGDNPSYETLLQGLVAIGRRDVTKSICETKGFATRFISLNPISETQTSTEHTLSPDGIPAYESQDLTHSHPTDSRNDRLGVSDVPLLMTILGGYSHKWRDIGTALGFTVPEQNNIEGKLTLLPTAPNSHFQDLLNKWVQWPNGAHTITPTIVALEAALQSQLVGLGAASEKLINHLLQKRPSKGSLTHQPVPECVEKYAEFLKSKYVEAMPLLPEGEWPPNRGRRYSGLTMVKRKTDSLPDEESVEERSKATTRGQVKLVSESESEKVIKSLDDVLDSDSSKPLKVLMEGVPGVGKSTLVRKSCKDWAEGKALKQFHLVILLTLKEQEIRGAKSMEDLVEVDDPDLKHEMKGYLQKSYGKDVLFILDGFDELKAEERSIFLKLFRGKLLHKCSIVLTSRSSAVEDFKYEEWIHRHVEILGFTEEQIKSYFTQNIADESKAKALASSLMKEMSSTSVSYTPLNCSILLYIFQQGKYKFPSKLTELFEAFVYSLLKRHSKKADISFDEVLHRSLSSLPRPLNGLFSALCKLAYNGLVKGKFLFSLQDIREAYQHSLFGDIEANLLGLLILTTSFSSHGKESHYQFLHVAIQEYLAARWIKDQPEVEQMKFLSNNWISPRMRIMLVFYAGTTQLRGPLFDDFFERMCSSSFLDSVLGRYITTVHHQLSRDPLGDALYRVTGSRSVAQPLAAKDPLPPWGDAVHRPCGSRSVATCRPENSESVEEEPSPVPVGTHALLNVVSMLAEANNSTIYHQIFERRTIRRIQVGHCRLTTVDCSALAKFLLHCPYPLEYLQFNFCYLTNQSLEIIHGVSASAHCRLNQCSVVELNYCSPSISAALSFLPQIPWFQRTKVLRLHGLQYPEGLHPEAFQLDSLLALKNLTDLSVSVVKIPEHHLAEYETVFSKFVKVLPTNKTLERLTYSQTPAASCKSFVQLMSALSHTSVSLTLGHTKVISADSLAIPDRICPQGLASAMTLAGTRGIQSLQFHQGGAHLPSCCCQISKINCFSSQCATTTYPAKTHEMLKTESPSFINTAFILNSLCQTKTIRELILFDIELKVSYNPYSLTICAIPGASSSLGISSVLGALVHVQVPDVKELVMESVLMCKDVSCALERMLSNNHTLTKVCLSRGADFKAAAHITSGLETLIQKPLNLSFSNFSVDIFKSLENNTSLEVLELNDLQLQKTPTQSEDVALGCAMVRMLTVNETLRSLELRCCGLDDMIVAHIANGLVKNHSLKVLDLSRNNLTYAGAVEIFKSLENNTSLEELNLSFNTIQLWKTHTQSGHESLGCAVERMLTVSQTLSSLNLWWCKLDDTIVTHIANALVENHSLKVLGLSGNIITRAGAVHIFKSLENNTSLEKLDLSFNDLRLQKIHTQGDDETLGNAVERMLTVNQTLTNVDLRRCGLDDTIAIHISNGLVKNHSLKVLDLSDNEITRAGATHIFKSLETNTDLEELDLSFNELCELLKTQSDDQTLGSAVERTLTVNQTLRSLNLGSCGLDDATAAHIANGLDSVINDASFNQQFEELAAGSHSSDASEGAKKHSLKVLDLCGNNVTSTGAVDIFKSLENNTSLEELDLSSNYLGRRLWKTHTQRVNESLGCVVERMLTVNQTLISLNLWWCELEDKVVAQIKAAERKCLCTCTV